MKMEPEIAGSSCCVADIGSHWMDLVEHVTGERIVELVADLERRRHLQRADVHPQSDRRGAAVAGGRRADPKGMARPARKIGKKALSPTKMERALRLSKKVSISGLF